jgi:hypothetical protein
VALMGFGTLYGSSYGGLRRRLEPALGQQRYETLEIEFAPPWLAGPNGTAFLAARGRVKDASVNRMLDVALATFISTAPTDALEIIARERNIRRFPNEPLESFRSRILGAPAFWPWAGTNKGVIIALGQLGYQATILNVRRYDASRWAEFEVFLRPAPRQFDDSTEERDLILALIRDVKAGHAVCAKIMYYPPSQYRWNPPLRWNPPTDAWGPPSVLVYER